MDVGPPTEFKNVHDPACTRIAVMPRGLLSDCPHLSQQNDLLYKVIRRTKTRFSFLAISRLTSVGRVQTSSSTLAANVSTDASGACLVKRGPGWWFSNTDTVSSGFLSLDVGWEASFRVEPEHRRHRGLGLKRTSFQGPRSGIMWMMHVRNFLRVHSGDRLASLFAALDFSVPATTPELRDEVVLIHPSQSGIHPSIK